MEEFKSQFGSYTEMSQCLTKRKFTLLNRNHYQEHYVFLKNKYEDGGTEKEYFAKGIKKEHKILIDNNFKIVLETKTLIPDKYWHSRKNFGTSFIWIESNESLIAKEYEVPITTNIDAINEINKESPDEYENIIQILTQMGFERTIPLNDKWEKYIKNIVISRHKLMDENRRPIEVRNVTIQNIIKINIEDRTMINEFQVLSNSTWHDAKYLDNNEKFEFYL